MGIPGMKIIKVIIKMNLPKYKTIQSKNIKIRKKACFDNKPDYITVGGPGAYPTIPVSTTLKNQ